MNSLAVFQYGAGQPLAPAYEPGPNSPALYFFEDFRRQMPPRMRANTALHVARHRLSKESRRLATVVDDNLLMIGLLDLKTLSGPELMAKVHQGLYFDALEVKDLMTPGHTLPCVTLENIARFDLDHLTQMLSDYEGDFCLVTEAESICGVVDIAAARCLLKRPTAINETSFASLVISLAPGH